MEARRRLRSMAAKRKEASCLLSLLLLSLSAFASSSFLLACPLGSREERSQAATGGGEGQKREPHWTQREKEAARKNKVDGEEKTRPISLCSLTKSMTSARRRRINQAAHAGLPLPPLQSNFFDDEDGSGDAARARRFAEQQRKSKKASRNGSSDLTAALLRATAAALVAALCLFLLLRHR